MSGVRDSQLLDAALSALCAAHRKIEIYHAYRAYDQIPLDTEDERGSLETFLRAAQPEQV